MPSSFSEDTSLKNLRQNRLEIIAASIHILGHVSVAPLGVFGRERPDGPHSSSMTVFTTGVVNNLSTRPRSPTRSRVWTNHQRSAATRARPEVASAYSAVPPTHIGNVVILRSCRTGRSGEYWRCIHASIRRKGAGRAIRQC